MPLLDDDQSNTYQYKNPATGSTPNSATTSLSPANPLPGQNYFPTAVNGLINEQEERTPQFYSDNLNYGLGKPTVGFNTAAPGQHESNDPMVQALQKQYSDRYATGVQNTKTQNDVNAPVAASNEESIAVKEAGQVYQNEVNNFNQQYQYEIQRQQLYNQWKTQQAQAEASLWGSIFSGIGTVGGAIIGGIAGGPPGAIAGAAAGGAAAKH